MPSKHLDSRELDSLFLLHNLQINEPLPRLQVSPKDTKVTGAVEGGERPAIDRETELEGWKQKGMQRGVADGGRW